MKAAIPEGDRACRAFIGEVVSQQDTVVQTGLGHVLRSEIINFVVLEAWTIMLERFLPSVLNIGDIEDLDLQP